MRDQVALYFPEHLEKTSAEVAVLTRPQREGRVRELIEASNQVLTCAEVYADDEDKDVQGIVGLFSGGNDSTTLIHLFRPRLTHTAHANTGIGVEETREYVRQTSEAFGLPLIEKTAPRYEDSYRAMVLDRGFPGPGQHWKMYQRLKERALREVRNDLITANRSQRVIFVAGRRRDESARRENVPVLEREGSIIWCSPLVLWTKPDMITYRLLAGDVPVNEVADILHMSGECLCGSFAKQGELEWVATWYPGAVELIGELEEAIKDRADIPPERRKWGWGAYQKDPAALISRAKVGRLCAACETKRQVA